MQNVLTGVSDGSSDVYVDGTSSFGNCGTNSIPGASMVIGRDGFSNTFDGDLVELGIWQGLTVSSGDKSGMNSNQHTFYAGM
jgi:hypothetical protein